LTLSPLRERRDDVCRWRASVEWPQQPGTRIPALSADAAHRLLTYPWPGNVRELDNVMPTRMILVNGPVIEPQHIQLNATCNRKVCLLSQCVPSPRRFESLRALSVP